MTSSKLFALIISGPTASGKSRLAEELLEYIPNAHIINADSMQLYKGLPTLTAQPFPIKEHHKLYNYIDPVTQNYSVNDWYNAAANAIKLAYMEKALPIIVGGTGFYIKTLLEGMSPLPEIGTEEYKLEAAERIDAEGHEAFYTWLLEKDPSLPEHIKPTDTQRLVRAYEVWAATGKSISYFQGLPKFKKLGFDYMHYSLLPPREALYGICNHRFEHMLKHGVLNEVEDFYEKYKLNTPLQNALGYHEFVKFLKGQLAFDEAVEQAKAVTRQFAKRQCTFIRHQFEDNIKVEQLTAKEIFHSLKENGIT